MLEIKALSFWYQVTAPPVVYQCTFVVKPREFVAVVGESGGGKSTILRLSSGLLQQHLGDVGTLAFLEGAVMFDGRLVSAPLDEFGYVPQNFSAGLYPAGSALENVLMAVAEDGISQSERALAAELLDVSGLSDVAHLNVRQLSGGQQQRVAICRALVKKPMLLFMDEPFANLDSSLRPEMGDLLNRIRERDELAILLVTHDIEGAIKLANTIVGVRATYGRPMYYTWSVGNKSPSDLQREIERWISDDSPQ